MLFVKRFYLPFFADALAAGAGVAFFAGALMAFAGAALTVLVVTDFLLLAGAALTLLALTALVVAICVSLLSVACANAIFILHYFQEDCLRAETFKQFLQKALLSRALRIDRFRYQRILWKS